ncbi:hypothetical protein LV178_07530, partial [Burkholderia mallei]|nr:hypothetical protein [Burkholderia mallei]
MCRILISGFPPNLTPGIRAPAMQPWRHARVVIRVFRADAGNGPLDVISSAECDAPAIGRSAEPIAGHRRPAHRHRPRRTSMELRSAGEPASAAADRAAFVVP